MFPTAANAITQHGMPWRVLYCSVTCLPNYFFEVIFSSYSYWLDLMPDTNDKWILIPISSRSLQSRSMAAAMCRVFYSLLTVRLAPRFTRPFPPFPAVVFIPWTGGDDRNKSAQMTTVREWRRRTRRFIQSAAESICRELSPAGSRLLVLLGGW